MAQTGITHRDRVRAALRFERPDRLPCNESFWDGTLQAWRRQGMPAGVSAEDYFDFHLCMMAMDASPRFEQRLLWRKDGYMTYEDRFGYTVKKRDGVSSSMEFSNHLTTDRAAWERIKPRFAISTDADEPARIDEASCFAHFDPYPSWKEAGRKHRRLVATERYVLLNVYGPWEATWRHRGMENLLLDLATDPGWVRDMADTYQDLVIATLRHCVDLGIKPDGLLVVEDLGTTRSMLMSPGSWRDVFKPAWSRLGSALGRHRIDFWAHSCGAVQPVLDDLLECGVGVVNPLQAAAGLDVVDLRRRYGKRMAFYGNIDVRKMLGTWEELEREIRRKVPVAREGGFVFHSDHSVPPQVDFRQYCRMLKTARRVFET